MLVYVLSLDIFQQGVVRDEIGRFLTRSRSFVAELLNCRLQLLGLVAWDSSRRYYVDSANAFAKSSATTSKDLILCHIVGFVNSDR